MFIALEKARLFRVSFQNRQQFSQFTLALPRVAGFFNALVGVLVKHFLPEGFQRFANRDNLHQHIGAVLIVSNHFLNTGNLSGNFFQAHKQALLVLFSVYVACAEMTHSGDANTFFRQNEPQRIYWRPLRGRGIGYTI